MATTSALKSANALDPEFFGTAANPEYANRYREAKEAEQRLMDMLEKRQQSSLSPSMLALAGEFLDPGRTGSFGEALGRGAKSYATAQAAEDKQLADNAMMRMQLANMRLEGASNAQMANMAKPYVQSLLGGAPTPQQGAMQPGESTLGPAVMINGREVTPQMIAGLKMLPATKSIGDALETEYKLRLEAVGSQPGFIFNKLTGKVQPVTPPGGADVEIRFPEKNGSSLMGSTEDLIKLREAREKGDVGAIDRIWNKLKFGATGATGAPAPTPTEDQAAPAPTGALTVQQKKEQDIRGEAVSKKLAEDQAAETSKFLKDDATNRESVYTAARIIKDVQGSPQMFGLLKEPGVGTALSSFIRDRGEQGNYAITKENLEDFLRKANFDTTKHDMTQVAKVASDLARLHFNFRRTYFSGSGQGAVSDREDMGVSKIMGTPSDTPEFLIGMSQLTGRRSKFDVDVAAGLRKYQQQHGATKTLEDFRRDSPVYKELLTGYENWLTKTYDLPAGLTQETAAPPAAATKLLKEGEQTTFANGQVWTLQNGKPTRVK